MAVSQEIPGRYHPADLMKIGVAILTHDFALREKNVLAAILLNSLLNPAHPNDEAFLPGLSALAACAKMSKGNASAILGRLRRCLVIEQYPNGFAFRLPIEHWKVPASVELAREFLPLLFQRDDLQGALRATFLQNTNLPTRAGSQPGVRPDRSSLSPGPGSGEVGVVVSRESAGSEAGAVAAAGKDYPSPPLCARPEAPVKTVPESGTSASGSRFGNPAPESAARPRPVRVLRVVPESGTDSSLKAVKVSAGTELLTAETLKGGRLTDPQRAILKRIEEIVGSKTWANWGGAWTNLVKRNSALVVRIIAEFQNCSDEGKLISNPGGWMWDLTKRWEA